MQTPVVILLIVVGFVSASPKKYNSDERDFQTSSANRYYETNLPLVVNTSKYDINDKYDSKEGKDGADRLRFGIPLTSYGNTGQGTQYGGNGVGYVFSPMKVDIGGIALGALIGLGAILIAPKFLSAFHGGHGYRSLENEMSSITQVLSRIDNSLEQHNIDSTSCMQQIICNYVNDAQRNMQTGEGNTLDQLIHTLANNTMFEHFIAGTAIKEAVELGKQNDIEKCLSLYARCPINRENVVKVVASLLPA